MSVNPSGSQSSVATFGTRGARRVASATGDGGKSSDELEAVEEEEDADEEGDMAEEVGSPDQRALVSGTPQEARKPLAGAARSVAMGVLGGRKGPPRISQEHSLTRL